jgi:DNA helicase-2/ATP-dependent DNA helicase PcrA
VLNAVDFGDLLLPETMRIFRANPDVLEYQKKFRLHPGRRVPGHQRRAISVAAAAGAAARPASQHLLRRRRRPVDLWLARRGSRQHPALREGLSRRPSSGSSATTAPPNTSSGRSGVIAHNEGRLGKTSVHRADDPGEKVKVHAAWDGEEEARAIGEEIEQATSKGHSLNDMAILVRASFQMRAFEDRFVTLGLPYRVIGGPRFYERAGNPRRHGLFPVVCQPADDLAFERIVNVPKRGLGDGGRAPGPRRGPRRGIPMLARRAISSHRRAEGQDRASR